MANDTCTKQWCIEDARDQTSNKNYPNERSAEYQTFLWMQNRQVAKCIYRDSHNSMSKILCEYQYDNTPVE